MRVFLFFLLFTITSAFAAEDFYSFKTKEENSRFKTLTTELRCLVCQNQNLSESNASLAKDLREQIYQQINHGKSDDDIIAFLTARYGDFILYRPPLNTHTIGLWFSPIVLLLFFLGYFIFYTRTKAKDSS